MYVLSELDDTYKKIWSKEIADKPFITPEDFWKKNWKKLWELITT